MFIETVRGPRRDWERVRNASKMLEEPPDGLLACIVLPEGDGDMHGVMVWETASARGDWAAAVMMPLLESGELAGVDTSPAPATPIDLFVKT